MDDVIHANETFLNDIFSNLMLDSSTNSEEILKEMRSIFNLIVDITASNERFYKLALEEYEARKAHLDRVKKYESEGLDVNK